MTNEERVAHFAATFARIKTELGKVIVGHGSVVDDVLICLVAGGHVLLEGVPGLGKTLLVKTLSQVLDLSFSRVQFTPDLMPADIMGTNIVTEGEDGRRRFQFQAGPVFANLVLADEINRATPKTQSALLEAMQEHSVTVAGVMHRLPEPFFVMATQNPIDMEGTYPLPEAQVDRFFFKIVVGFPGKDDLMEILERTTSATAPAAATVASREDVERLRVLAREVVAATHLKEYIARLTLATHPNMPEALPEAKRFVRYGASPRGAQALTLAAKIRALMDGRANVGFEDVAAVAVPALRHRIILNFEGEAEGFRADTLIRRLLEEIPHDTAPVGV